MRLRSGSLIACLVVALASSLTYSCAGSRAFSAHAAARKRGTIGYKLSIAHPSSQYLQVELQVPASAARGASTQVAIPAWTPGSYLIRDFGRHVYKVVALDDKDRPLPVLRDDKQQWTIQNRGQGFRVRYEVFADELSVRTAFVNDAMALLNTASVLMYLRQGKALPVTLSVTAPPNWQVFTGLEGSPKAYRAPNYDELIDAPIMMGQGAYQTSFNIDKTKIDYVVLAPSGTNADMQRLGKDAKAIFNAFVYLMGGVNFGHYTSMLLLDPNARGGLEHKYSTSMLLPSYIFNSDKGYRKAQSLLAHEFFHAWNVKRIHDEKLGPFDYDKEVYTDLLWFHEGFTETIEAQALLVAGAYDDKEYLKTLAESWTKYTAHPGRNHSSIATLSREAWIKFYRSAANLRNTSISYYFKGDLIGLCLDLTIRLAAAKRGKQGSLAGMFRRMWGQKAAHEEMPITQKDILAYASQEAGEDLSAFFQDYVYGTKELPLPKLLQEAGIEVKAQKPWLDDKGKPSLELAAKRFAIGAQMQGALVKSVEPGSPAAKAGLVAHDEIIAVQDRRWQEDRSLAEQLVGSEIGTTATLSLFRRGRLVTTSLPLTQSSHRIYQFTRPNAKGLSKLMRTVQKDWLDAHLPSQRLASTPEHAAKERATPTK